MKFYDTCALITNFKNIVNKKEQFLLSSITLSELEGIKTSSHKSEDTKYRVREILHWLKDNENNGQYEVILYEILWDMSISKFGYEINNDSRIAISALKVLEKGDTFITNDLSCRAIAKSMGLAVEVIDDNTVEEYTGFKQIEMNDEELGSFYSIEYHKPENIYNLLENQYFIITQNNKPIDKIYKWCGGRYEEVRFRTTKSVALGNLKPKDVYQQCALDSFYSNQISVLKGKAGTGKSLLGVSYLFDRLEHGDIDKIIMFVNPVATRGAAKLGFLPGTKDQKILDSQIGNFLISKIGDRFMVEDLIEKGKIFLVPMGDCRGFDTTHMNAGIYVTEAQNMSIDMMKLLLQRIGEDCICIIEGDEETQCDLKEYEGDNNGLRRLSQVFKGQDYYGEVLLQTCYRSKIAKQAELM